MDQDDYTAAEQELIDRVPKLPRVAALEASKIWIIEWLNAGDDRTGEKLHQWMEARRPGWSNLLACNSKAEVLAAIADATTFARTTGHIPVLHIETHGGNLGLGGPSSDGGTEELHWDELTESLQILNAQTGCNLLVVLAACTGFAGILALARGPIAPALALVGPTNPLEPSELLDSMKEFYRRWSDPDARMHDMVESASRELKTVLLEYEPFATLFYESLLQDLVRRSRLAKALVAGGDLSAARAQFPPPELLQHVWGQMFMFDTHPGNRDRFGLDLARVVQVFTEDLEAAVSSPLGAGVQN